MSEINLLSFPIFLKLLPGVLTTGGGCKKIFAGQGFALLALT